MREFLSVSTARDKNTESQTLCRILTNTSFLQPLRFSIVRSDIFKSHFLFFFSICVLTADISKHQIVHKGISRSVCCFKFCLGFSSLSFWYFIYEYILYVHRTCHDVHSVKCCNVCMLPLILGSLELFYMLLYLCEQ